LSRRRKAVRVGPAGEKPKALPVAVLGDQLPWATTWALVGLVCGLELWGLCNFFPPSGWFNAHPFYTDSYPLHFARGLIGAQALRRHLRLWCYSPALMAGYPAGTRSEPMGFAPALLFWVAGWFHLGALSFGQAANLYKLMVVALLATAAPAMALAASIFGLGGSAVALSAGLGVLGLFSIPGIQMMRSGMFAFLSTSSLCVLAGAYMYRWLGQAERKPLFGLSLGCGALTYLHPLASLLLVPPALGALAGAQTGRRRLELIGCFALALIVALGWVLPMLFTWSIGLPFANWWQTPSTLLSSLRLMVNFRLPFPPLLVLAAAVYGCLKAPMIRPFVLVWLAATVLLAWAAYFGSVVGPLDEIEPARLEISFYFYAAPMAALGVCQAWRALSGWRPGSRRVLRGAMAAAGVIFALASLELSNLDLGVHGPIATTLPVHAREIESWIPSVNDDARIAIESGWAEGKYGEVLLPYFGADLGLLWALRQDRELIGGSPSEGFSTFSYVDFGAGFAFGKALLNWNPAKFAHQLELYNIGRIIVWSQAARDFLSQVPNVQPLLAEPPYALFGVAGVHSYLLAGQARAVHAQTDCIVVKDAQPGQIVLKYHYFATMRTWPPLPIHPVAVGNGDPVPFIEVDNDTARDLRIFNAGFTGWGSMAAACRH